MFEIWSAWLRVTVRFRVALIGFRVGVRIGMNYYYYYSPLIQCASAIFWSES